MATTHDDTDLMDDAPHNPDAPDWRTGPHGDPDDDALEDSADDAEALHVADEDVAAAADSEDPATVASEDAPAGDQAPETDEPADPDAPATEAASDESPTEAQTQALVNGMAAMAQQAAAGDEALREEDGVFDAQSPTKALQSIARLNEVVVARRGEWERAREEAAAAKKSYDAMAKRLSGLIEELTDTETGVSRQPKLATVREEVLVVDGQPARCQYERTSGRPCGVCRSRATDAPAPLADAPAHPDHAEHASVALAEFHAQILARLSERKVFVTAEELAALEPADLDGLIGYADRSGPVPPPCLQRAHVTGEAGPEGRQHCTQCGSQVRARFEPGTEEPLFYLAGSFVGFGCEPEDPAAETAARPPKKRGAMKGRKKHDPEAERAEQVKAGRAKSVKAKPAKKAKAAKKTKAQ